MKLHLPKLLLTAVMAAGVAGSSAAAMSVSYDYTNGSVITIDTSKNYYDGVAVYYSVNEAKAGTLVGADFTQEVSFDLNLGWTTTADTSLIYVNAAGGTKWGFMTASGNTLVEQWANEKWTDTGSGAKDIPLTGEGSVKLTASINNSATKLKYADSETWDLFDCDKLLSSTAAINSYYINANNITNVYVKDAGSATFTAGAWTQTFAANEVIAVTGKRYQINGGENKDTDGGKPNNLIDSTKTIVVGNGGQLYLQTWQTGDVVLSNNIVLGTGGNQNSHGALRFGNDGSDSDGAFTTTLSGTITVVENSKISAHGTNAITIGGAVRGENYKLTVAGKAYSFTNTVTLGTLELLNTDVNKPSTMEFSGAVNVGTLTVGANTTATFNGAVNIGSAIVNNGTIALNNKLIVDNLSGFDSYIADASTATDNGIVSLGNVYTIWQGNANTGSTTKVTYDNVDYDIVDGKFTMGKDVFLVAKETVYVGGTTPTEGTKDATSFFVREDATMELGAREQGAALTTGQVICATEGTGTINVKANATLDNGTATPFEGTLKINSGATLYLGSSSEGGETSAWTVDVSSLAGFELAGGTLQFRGGSVALGDINVTAKSTLSLFDQNAANSKINIGTLTLGANLELNNRWKSNTAIEKLTGSGDLTWGSAATEDSNNRYVHINSMEGYTGTLTFVGNTNNTQELKLGIGGQDGSFGAAFSTGTIKMGSNTNLVINGRSGGASATTATDAQQVTSLMLGDNTNVKSLDGSYNYTKLTLETGATATLQHEWNKFQFIGALVGEDAEIVLKHTRQTGYSAHTQGAAFILDGAGDTNYSGVINLQNAAEDNQSGLIVKNDTTGTKLADTVVKFTGDGNKSLLAFVTNEYTVQNATINMPAADKVSNGTVAGLDGDKGNVCAATLTVDVAESEEYTYGGGLSVSSLKKAGAGTQNISSDMSTYTGAVEVSGGKLALTNAAEGANTTLTSLTLDGGALDVSGTLTLSNVTVDLSKYTAGTNIELVTAGTLSAEALSVSYANGATTVGNYTGTLAQDGNSLWLTWKDATPTVSSITTSVSTEEGWYTLSPDGTTLTLTVTKSLAGLAADGSVMVDLLTDDQLSAIMSDANYKNPYVLLELVDSDKNTVAADAFNKVVFIKGETGQNYWGEMVGGQLMYNVERIPEPTTATLSLLALMGLAARRRRQK